MTKQLLHLVIGGELKDPTSTEFADLGKVELVGLYPSYAEAVTPPGGARRRPRSTTLTCATSSSISIG